MARVNEGIARMRGRFVEAGWQYDPALYAPPRYRRACRYDAFIPSTLEHLPPLAPEVAGTISIAEDAIRQLNTVAQPGLQPLARLLLRSESIASSKVEGMQVDARTLARAEARSDLGGAIGNEAAEVLANIDAMQLAVDEATAADELTLDHLLDTHRVLLAATANADRVAGVVRDKQNWIGGNDYNPCDADFVPPPPVALDGLLVDLCALANTEHLPPVIQAAVAHAQFETIHPFDDGNGRTGRALIHVILRRRGLAPAYVPPISVVLAADKDGYIDGLKAFREGAESRWIERFAVATARSAALAARYLEHVAALQDGWRRQLRSHSHPREDAAVWAVIEVLPGYPFITLPVAVAATGRSKPSVNAALTSLVSAGVLEPVSAARRNRAWEAVGLLDLLDGLQAGR
jgi:Fic family protein